MLQALDEGVDVNTIVNEVGEQVSRTEACSPDLIQAWRIRVL